MLKCVLSYSFFRFFSSCYNSPHSQHDDRSIHARPLRTVHWLRVSRHCRFSAVDLCAVGHLAGCVGSSGMRVCTLSVEWMHESEKCLALGRKWRMTLEFCLFFTTKSRCRINRLLFFALALILRFLGISHSLITAFVFWLYFDYVWLCQYLTVFWLCQFHSVSPASTRSLASPSSFRSCRAIRVVAMLLLSTCAHRVRARTSTDSSHI
jgi:hypothetical protein